MVLHITNLLTVVCLHQMFVSKYCITNKREYNHASSSTTTQASFSLHLCPCSWGTHKYLWESISKLKICLFFMWSLLLERCKNGSAFSLRSILTWRHWKHFAWAKCTYVNRSMCLDAVKLFHERPSTCCIIAQYLFFQVQDGLLSITYPLNLQNIRPNSGAGSWVQCHWKYLPLT